MHYPCAINRIDDHIVIEDVNIKRRKNLNLDDEERQKMGEIMLKDNKYYFIPNKKENMNINDFTGEDLFAWLIFKGTKYPINKNKYRLKEGDIIKLGRIWLIVRHIYIPIKKEKNSSLERKATDCIMVSYHNQGNQSLNIKDDFNFKSDNKLYANLIDNSDDDESSDSDKKNTNKINFISDKKEKKDKNKDNKKEKDKEKDKDKDKEKKDKEKKNNQKICRICYLEEDNPSLNPLIRPCKCSGSMKYIHLKCLIMWIKTKVEIDSSEYLDNGKYKIYSSEKVECELCKEVFPNYINHNNKLYNLMDFEQNFGEENNDENYNNIIITESENNKDSKSKAKKESKNKKKKEDDKSQDKDNNKKINTKNIPYIIFDSIPLEKNVPAYRYIAKFSKNILKIGRGIDMDLIMNDLSISRNHCHLEINETGEVLLKDVNSKFGTLILIQAKRMEILENQTLTIQVGRTFFNFGLSKNNSLFSCCKAEEIDLTKSYEKINYRAVKYKKFCTILTEIETDDEEVQIQTQTQNEVPKKEESLYENALKDINNKKNNNDEIKMERMKTTVDKSEKDIIFNSKIEFFEKNKSFEQEKINPDF